MYKSLKDLYAEKCLGRAVPALPRQTILLPKQILLEGGAGGHMIHPFDIPGVKTGKDLIQVFHNAVEAIESEVPAEKIDGSNVSIKIARDDEGKILLDDEGKMQFGLDRGAKHNVEDIKGVTIANLGKRLVSKDPTKPHGLIEAASLILRIFNNSLPSIKEELEQLGMFEKTPQRFFNAEYVYGHTNVVAYDRNFIAIHGVNQFDPETRKPSETNYDVGALERIIEKVRPWAKEAGFDLYSTIPAIRDEDVEAVDFGPALQEKFTVVYTADHAVTKTLNAWLGECHNPVGEIVTFADGTKASPYSKKVYQAVTSGQPLDTIIKDNNEKTVRSAICGAIVVRSTIVLGQVVKGAVKSEFGNVKEREGIVVRNLYFNKKPVGNPVKFTGEFIIGKDQGKFVKSQDENTADNDYLNPNGRNNLNFAYAPQIGAQDVRVADGISADRSV